MKEHTHTPCAYLCILCEGAEDLFGHLEGLQEVLSALQVNCLIVRVVPVEVTNGLLQTKKVVHSADNDIHGCCVARLCAKIILEDCVCVGVCGCVKVSSVQLQRKLFMFVLKAISRMLSPSLCPSQSSWRNRNREMVKADCGRTLQHAGKGREREN